jgi:tRNA A37 threonylcarbamoyladenosine synthetase subunit TsaC/SUA5/YrdC
LLLDRLRWSYSSSANISGERYNGQYAEDATEVIISEPNSRNGIPSTIYKLGINRIKKIR